MSPKKPDLEARAEALLKRIQRHNRGMDSLTALEVRSLLKEIRAIGKMSLSDTEPEDVLGRVDRIMQQAVKEPVASSKQHQAMARRIGQISDRFRP